MLVSPLTGLITSKRTVGTLGVRAPFHRRLMTVYHMATNMLHAAIPSFSYGSKLWYQDANDY